jgi:glutathione S-transferase
MKLIGRFLSPFVRRVGIALHLYEMEFEHEPLSVVDDRAAVDAVNRLSRIPCLVLDDGDTLIDSHQILAELDRMVGPERALVPRDPADARAYGQMIALCTGSLEKSVATVYEIARRPKDKIWDVWGEQCRAQSLGGVQEAEARAPEGLLDKGYLFGSEPTHADVAAVLAADLARALSPNDVSPETFPRLSALAERFASHPAFERTRPM